MTENQLHLYLTCSQKYHLSQGQSNPLDSYTLLAKEAIEILATSYTENSFEDRNISNLFFNSIEICKEKYQFSDEQTDEILLYGISSFNKLIQRLKLWHLIPISGPVDRQITLNKLTVDIHLSCLLMTPKQVFRGIVFSPLYFKKDIDWNLVHRLQYETLKNLYKTTINNPVRGQTPKLFIIGWGGHKGYRVNTIEKNIKKDDLDKHISLTESMILSDYHWPMTCCNFFKCPFRDKCYPK